MNKTIALIGLLAIAPAANAQSSAHEAATARRMQAIRNEPNELYAFLREMPKGADLHSHLSGTTYAESFLAWAAEAGICIRQPDMKAVAAPCEGAAVPAAQALAHDSLRGAIIDAWSMRNWTGSHESGHDHFFATFSKFSLANRGRDGDMLAEAMRRAYDGRVSYLEIMNTPGGGVVSQMASRVAWTDDFSQLVDSLRANGLAGAVQTSRDNFAETLTRQRALMGCGTATADPACAVEVRFLWQVLRGMTPTQVFAQLLTAFETVAADSNVVGFNMVQAEDCLVCMRDFSLHMRMIDFLHARYPQVKITLHAGELVPGLVPTEGLRFHIRESVQKGHASRIGHGVAVMYEDKPYELLREMAEKNVMVEINLTSNAVILGVEGAAHPLDVYQSHGVPTALSTDDEGVSRSEMTLEYRRAVQQQGLDYLTLKRMARNSLHYAFIQGESLWADAKNFRRVAVCTTSTSAACEKFLAGSPKARLQLKLEREFAEFERAQSR